MNTMTSGRATIGTTTTRQAMATPMQYLDKAMTRLRDLGLVPLDKELRRNQKAQRAALRR